MRFEFATATKIIFGQGTLRELGRLAGDFGRRALVVTGRNSTRAAPVLEILHQAGMQTILFPCQGEPTLETVERGRTLAKTEQCELVVGFGGGSALDAGKAIAVMLTNEGELLEYLEVIGRGAQLNRPSAPFIAIPTTAGTGSEVTRNAVLASSVHRVKVSLRSPLMLPKIALVDPLLTKDLPASVTASTGLDALTQLIEPYVSSRANPATDALCLEGMRRAASSLRRVVENGEDMAMREDMAIASLFGGLALANAGLGAVHGFAGPIGGMFSAPHGAVCAALLPWVMEMNITALQQRDPQSPSLQRYQTVARILTGKPAATPPDGTAWVRELVGDLRIPCLRTHGVTPADIPDLVAKANQASSMKANPIPLNPQELASVLFQAL